MLANARVEAELLGPSKPRCSTTATFFATIALRGPRADRLGLPTSLRPCRHSKHFPRRKPGVWQHVKAGTPLSRSRSSEAARSASRCASSSEPSPRVRQWFDLLVLNFVLADGLLKLRRRQAGSTSKCARKARLRRVLTIKGNLAE